MILLFYNLALLAALLLGSPWWLFRLATTAKYRHGLLERLGFRYPPILTQVPSQKPNQAPAIWIHAVSVGEVLAITRLVAELDRELSTHRVLISTTTRTGQTLARERFGQDRVFYCPLDLPWATTAYLNRLRPAMLVLAETEFWPNLLDGCFRRGIPVAVVNARISDRSWPRYWRLRRLWKPMLSRLSAVLAQSEIDAGRLRALGCALERVTVCGNIKFDIQAAPETAATRLIGAQSAGLRLVVAGSTLDGEESMLLSAWPALLQSQPRLAMILAPRHPERFEAVASLLQNSGFPWRRRTCMENAKDHTALTTGEILESDESLQPGQILVPGEILLLDTIGELASIYALAVVAFIGGSLVPAGGHNPLEPAQFGIPIVMGEHYANFRPIVDQLQSRDAIRITTPRELAPNLLSLLENPATAAMGARAKQLFEEQAGATARSLAAIQAILVKPSATRSAD